MANHMATRMRTVTKAPVVRQTELVFPVDGELASKLGSLREVIVRQDESSMKRASYLYLSLVGDLLPEEYQPIQRAWSDYIHDPNGSTASVLTGRIAIAESRAGSGMAESRYYRTTTKRN